MSKISVIIPTFNRATVVLRALNSAATQTHEPHEILLIDDGSQDGTEELVEKWREQSAYRGQFIYKKTKNCGVSAARNMGAQLATADWLAFLDSDDEWLPQKLARQSSIMSKFRFVHCEEIWIRNGQRVNAMKKHYKSGGRIFSRCVELCCVSPSSVLIEKTLFDSCNGFREDFPVCEDYEMWLRISAKHNVGFIEDALLIKYGGHEDQLSRKFKAMDFYRAQSLIPFLTSIEISEGEREMVINSLAKKCDILTRGYLKHNNLAQLELVQSWKAQTESARTAMANVHSLTDARPRAELSAML